MGEKENNPQHWPGVSNQTMNPQQVMSVIHLVSHVCGEQTSQNARQSSLAKMWASPSPLSTVHSAAFEIILYLFIFFSLHALFHQKINKLIRRSPSEVTCWWERVMFGATQMWCGQFVMVLISAPCMYLCAPVCLSVHRCMYIISGVTGDRPLGNKTTSWMQRPLG